MPCDPITTGLVPNLNRPTDNVTGATLMAGALPTKRLELLHELLPATKNVGMLVNPKGARRANGESLVDIGRSYGVSHSTISRL
jgi:putative ABC transport system substrate-binding protein